MLSGILGLRVAQVPRTASSLNASFLVVESPRNTETLQKLVERFRRSEGRASKGVDKELLSLASAFVSSGEPDGSLEILKRTINTTA